MPPRQFIFLIAAVLLVAGISVTVALWVGPQLGFASEIGILTALILPALLLRLALRK